MPQVPVPTAVLEVLNVVWWKHSCPSGDISAAKVHNSIRDNIDPETGDIPKAEELTLTFPKDEGIGTLTPEIIPGF